MEWVKRQGSHDRADMDAYAVLRRFQKYPDLSIKPIINGREARRFDCSVAYRPALDAVKAGDLELARLLISEAGVYDSTEQPPDWCYDRS